MCSVVPVSQRQTLGEASTTNNGMNIKLLQHMDDRRLPQGPLPGGQELCRVPSVRCDRDPAVAEFYRLNHEQQTVDYVLEKEKEYFGLNKGMKSIWEAAEFLNTLVDDSDPDTDLTQIGAPDADIEAIRRDEQPRWMVLTGFIHDLGKCLCLYGEPQWGVVGDTFPVGCAWSRDIVFPEYFANNPDRNVAQYQTKYGIYEPNCGLENVHMSLALPTVTSPRS